MRPKPGGGVASVVIAILMPPITSAADWIATANRRWIDATPDALVRAGATIPPKRFSHYRQSRCLYLRAFPYYFPVIANMTAPAPGRGLPVSGRKSEDNPFIVGTKGVPLCFTVMPEYAQVSKLRIGAK